MSTAGSSHSSPTPALHQYACLRCRARRVKCDKILIGCANCANHGMQCVYSARRPRKSIKAAHQQQDQRSIQHTLQYSSTPSSVSVEKNSSVELTSSHESEGSEVENNGNTTILKTPKNGHRKTGKAQDSEVVLEVSTEAETIIGDAILSPKFTPNDDKSPKSFERLSSIDATSLLSYKSPISKQQLQAQHPPPKVMLALWDYFTLHVDQMVKVLYKPTAQLLVHRAASDLDSIETADAPLLFAIWLATTLSLSPSENLHLQKAPKHHLTLQYQRALESALHHANWLTTTSLSVLQSLTLYLYFASETSPQTWLLSSALLSLAQTLSLHTEPPPPNTSPLTTLDHELRRRLWWNLVHLDVRTSQNLSLDPHVPYTTTTLLPTHINDADIPPDPGNTAAVEPRTTITDTTLTLAKLEATRATLLFARSPNPLPTRSHIIHAQIARLHTFYLPLFAPRGNQTPTQTAFQHLCALAIRLTSAQLWKILHDACAAAVPPIPLAYTANSNSNAISNSDSDAEPGAEAGAEADPAHALIAYNADVLDIAFQLPCAYKQYGWFFRSRYTQWHALAYLLMQLCVHTRGAAVECAWEVLDRMVREWERKGMMGRLGGGRLWGAVVGLLERAKGAMEGDKRGENASVIGTGRQRLMGDGDVDLALRDGLIGDPFLGSVEDLGAEMNWERLDGWARVFEEGYELQRRGVVQDQEMADGFVWW